MTDGLLLIHAFPLDARMWETQRGLGVPTVAPNLPGFGGSEPAGDVMTMAAAAARCVVAIDAAGWERAAVVGLSMGGYVAFELWRRVPERIIGLVFANTRANADTPDGAAGRRALAARMRTEGNVLAATPPPLLAADAPEERWATVRGWIADQPAEAIAAASLGMADRPDSTQDLATIDVPTLVITSDADTLIPSEATAPIADGVAGARLEVIGGAGHLTNVEAPDRFNEVLVAHLAACGLDPRP
jgi:pimeloyl-ACP methyl ester carboxylesterase